MKFPKIIVIVGTTSSGKSDLAVYLAKKINGEVISADSRQVYHGLDIGTGKITKDEMKGIPHHMLDVANPKKVFTAGDFKREAEKTLRYIVRNGKVPIIAGGTGFYIDALLGIASLPEVPPNKALRDKLEKKTTKELFAYLKRLDHKRAKTIQKENRPRLIRAIEIAKTLGKVPTIKREKRHDVLKIGIRMPDEVLKKKIRSRLLSRLRKGMIAEAKRLHKKGLSWKRMEELGLEYRYLAQHLQGKITKEEMIEKLNTEIWRYSKRQKTWWKRDKEIKWFSPSEVEGFSPKETGKIEREVKRFLK